MKKMLISLLLVSLFPFFIGAYGQQKTVRGTVQDTSGRLQPGASVTLRSPLENITTATDQNGRFHFVSIRSDSFSVTVTSVGFRPFTKHYFFGAGAGSITLPVIALAEESNALDQVIITAIIPVRVKEDTVEFDARAYKVREGDAVEEMVKKLPGVEVDKDGNITTEGEPITKVRLNGKDFFGDDAAAALQNLPADIVKNLQIIDDYGELAKITGIKSAEPVKILNINTEPDKENGYFVKGAAGLGTNNRYAARLRANDFKENSKMAFDGNLNNTGSGEGLRTTRSVKTDYNAEWGDKINSYGSYRFNNGDNNVIQKIARQDFYSDYTRFEQENRFSSNKRNEHRFSWNLEYQIDKNNYLKVEPGASFSSSASNSNGLTYTQLLSANSVRDYSSSNTTKASDFSTDLYFNHKFNKPGRNFSVSADVNSSHGKDDREVMNEYSVTDSLAGSFHQEQLQFWNGRNGNRRFRIEGAYMEPINERSFIELEYDWSRTLNERVRDVRDGKAAPDSSYLTSLSNNYKYRFVTNRIELNYQYRQSRLSYLVGIMAQPTLLEGRDLSRNISTEKRNFNLIPTARFSFNVSKRRKLTASYRGRASQPGFTQLQPVTDNSNPQNTVIGNPDLKPEFNNRFEVKYKQSGRASGYTVLTKVDLQRIQNKIVTSRVIIPDSLKQQTTYLNADGFYTASGHYSITKPFAGRKFTVTWYGGNNYSRNIAFNNNERNIGKTMSFSQGVKLGMDIEDVIDARLNIAYSANKTRYSLASYKDRRTSKVFLGVEGRNYFSDNWVMGYNFSQTINKGYNTANPDPTILNMYLEYQFLKGNRARLRMQGFDLLNENTGISRDIFDNQIVDRQTNRLGRYFLLSLEFRLNKFGAG